MITQIIRNVVRLLLAIGVVVGIPAWPYYIQAADLIDFAVTYYSRASDQGRFNSLVDEAAGLRDKAFVFVEVTVYTFLIITGLLAIHTVVLLSWERARLGRSPLLPSVRHRRLNASSRTAFCQWAAHGHRDNLALRNIHALPDHHRLVNPKHLRYGRDQRRTNGPKQARILLAGCSTGVARPSLLCVQRRRS